MKRSYVIMGLLVLVFIAPGIAAYLVYTHPSWLATPTNRGRILRPAKHIEAVRQTTKWQLLYWSPHACEAACVQRMDALARIRLSLGRRLYQVDTVLAWGAAPLLAKVQQQLQEKDIRVLRVDTTIDGMALGEKPAIYIVTPEHDLILMYEVSQPAEDIFHDLKLMVSGE